MLFSEGRAHSTAWRWTFKDILAPGEWHFSLTIFRSVLVLSSLFLPRAATAQPHPINPTILLYRKNTVVLTVGPRNWIIDLECRFLATGLVASDLKVKELSVTKTNFDDAFMAYRASPHTPYDKNFDVKGARPWSKFHFITQPNTVHPASMAVDRERGRRVNRKKIVWEHEHIANLAMH